MTDKNKATPESAALTITSNSNTEATKKLRAMLFILETPQGVTEKSINRAANVMSGRNYPTNLQRKHGIMLALPKDRRRGEDGSLYTVYKLESPKEARKLAALILHHCRKYSLSPPDKECLASLDDCFPDRSQPVTKAA